MNTLAQQMVGEGKELAIQIMPMPGDANPHGDVFGGWIKKSK